MSYLCWPFTSKNFFKLFKEESSYFLLKCIYKSPNYEFVIELHKL